MKVSCFYDNNRHRFSATIAWFSFGHNYHRVVRSILMSAYLSVIQTSYSKK